MSIEAQRSIRNHNHQRDLVEVAQLQEIFNQALGITNSKAFRLSYNPVLPKWKVETLTTEDQIHQFKQYETFQVQTALRERNHAAVSSIKYLPDEHGNLRNELFPDEPFDSVLLRGLAYRRKNDSIELEREQGEYRGWMEAISALLDSNTPLHSKALIVSGPGIVSDTNYKNNFVDIYEVHENIITKQRHVTMTRYSSQIDYHQYWDKLTSIEPDYFKGFSGPIYAWFLSHPIYLDSRVDNRTTDEIFDQAFEQREGAMKEDDFEKIYIMCLPVILHYIKVLCNKSFDPVELAVAWNAVLVQNDLAKHHIDSNENNVSTTFLSVHSVPYFETIQQRVEWLGRQPVKTFAAGCGSSSGFNLNEIGSDPIASLISDPLQSLFSNSVGKFALGKNLDEDEYGSLTFKCNTCGGEHTRPPHIIVKICPTKQKEMEPC
ncbi:hypothetical protein HY041_03590 [Candidatus Roizmanbacteria bacterium]|nr:hypothetical protein [Candidatus Roizmanbacteria bacterium]